MMDKGSIDTSRGTFLDLRLRTGGLMAREDLLLLQTFESLTESLHSFGMHLPQPDRTLEPVLPQIPAEIKNKIRVALEGYINIIKTPVTDSSNISMGHFEIFRKVAGLKLADPNFMKDFEEGDICEAYTKDHLQIFRNLEFFKACSYDLFTLTVVPWNQLFKRPQIYSNMLLEAAEGVVRESRPVFQDPAPDHIISECYQNHNKSFLYHIKRTGCMLDAVTNEPSGYVTIINVRELDENSQSGFLN